MSGGIDDHQLAVTGKSDRRPEHRSRNTAARCPRQWFSGLLVWLAWKRALSSPGCTAAGCPKCLTATALPCALRPSEGTLHPSKHASPEEPDLEPTIPDSRCSISQSRFVTVGNLFDQPEVGASAARPTRSGPPSVVRRVHSQPSMSCAAMRLPSAVGSAASRVWIRARCSSSASVATASRRVCSSDPSQRRPSA